MRRVLAIFTALAVVLALATPASAKKGGGHGPPDPPDDPEPPPICRIEAGVLIGYNGGELLCAWTVTDLDTEWRITMEPNGVAAKMFISVRDDDPVGDFCAYRYAPGRSADSVFTDFELPAVTGEGQCSLFGQQFGHGDPNEFFLLVNAKVSGDNYVTVMVEKTGQ